MIRIIHRSGTSCQPLLAGLTFLAIASLALAQEQGDWDMKVPPFSLTERSGRTVTRDDLLGHPWIADFVFTRCQGPCPALTARMAKLQGEVSSGVRLVTFTLDPDFDTPEVLTRYANLHRADSDRWLFLRGDRQEVRRLVCDGFKWTVQDDPQAIIIHSKVFVLVNGEGKIVTWGEGTDDAEVERIASEANRLARLAYFPAINASLNGTCALLLIVGLVFVKRKAIAAHKACMVSAFFVSIVFLASYLYYHAQHGVTRFPCPGWPKAVYLSVLGTHTVLAALVPFLAIVTLRRGFKMDLERHRRIARWTFPIWLYVSLTGVAVYWMLYHWHPV